MSLVEDAHSSESYALKILRRGAPPAAAAAASGDRRDDAHARWSEETLEHEARELTLI